jgi:Mce-associated membrane protein
MAEPAHPAGELSLLSDDDVVDVEHHAAGSDDATDTLSASKEPMPAVRRAMLFGFAVVLAVGVLLGWLGFRAYQSHEAQAEQSQFLQAARQGALNLTTIDWQHAEHDIQRILDGATGQFHDDFATRSQPFVDVVKQAKSTSVGTITEAGVESEGDGSAQVLVAVAVKTSNAGAPEPDPRAWRMRISVERVGDQAKVSNVEFVS